MLRMVPSENTKIGICRLIKPGILLLLLVLPLNAGTPRLDGIDKDLTNRKIVKPEQCDKYGRNKVQQSAKETEKNPITNHQISPWNRIQVF
jgi:hypothetical protein